MYQTIKVATLGRVCTIQFDRPEALNALNSALLEEVLEAATKADSDPTIGCIVLTGNARAFAAGADIEELATHDYPSMYATDFFSGWDRFAQLRTPKVAAIRGYALGGGCEVAMMCDILIASDTAKFGQPEVKIGCIPGIGGTQRLTKIIGRACAMDMILTGRMIDAPEALQMGLVSRIVPDDNIKEEVAQIAKKVAGFSKDITLMARACVHQAEQSGLHAGMQFERQMYHALFGSKAQKEGMTAFLEKRAPVFNEGP